MSPSPLRRKALVLGDDLRSMIAVVRSLGRRGRRGPHRLASEGQPRRVLSVRPHHPRAAAIRGGQCVEGGGSATS